MTKSAINPMSAVVTWQAIQTPNSVPLTPMNLQSGSAGGRQRYGKIIQALFDHRLCFGGCPCGRSPGRPCGTDLSHHPARLQLRPSTRKDFKGSGKGGDGNFSQNRGENHLASCSPVFGGNPTGVPLQPVQSP